MLFLSLFAPQDIVTLLQRDHDNIMWLFYDLERNLLLDKKIFQQTCPVQL